MARNSTTPRYAVERKVIAWLKSTPRTSPDLALLLCISPNHASATLRRMWRQGKLTRKGGRRLYWYSQVQS